MKTEACSECYFYRINPDNLREGFCCYYPPRMIPIQSPQGFTITAAQAPTRAEGWCGMWKPRILPQ